MLSILLKNRYNLLFTLSMTYFVTSYIAKNDVGILIAIFVCALSIVADLKGNFITRKDISVSEVILLCSGSVMLSYSILYGALVIILYFIARFLSSLYNYKIKQKSS